MKYYHFCSKIERCSSRFKNKNKINPIKYNVVKFITFFDAFVEFETI